MADHAPSIYNTGKARRDALAAAKRHGYVALIDIGSSKIACLMAAVGENAQADITELGGYGALKIVGAGVTRSAGVKQGAIIEVDAVSDAIRRAVASAEAMAGAPVFQALVSFSGGQPRSAIATAEVKIAGDVIERADIDKALNACRPVLPARKGELAHRSTMLPPGRQILQARPINWSIDGEDGLREPAGISASKLSVDLHSLSVDESALKTLASVMAKADLELAGVCAAPQAAGQACLVEDELEYGAACVDIGGGTTSVSLFIRGEMVFADVVRMGGKHITMDLVRGLGLETSDAERLKVLEGSCVAAGVDLDRPLEDSRETGRGARSQRGKPMPSRSDLIGVIRPRMEEILELASDRLDMAGFGHLSGRRVVLTGGASLMAGSIETAQRVFDRQVRLGRPLRLAGLPANFGGPEYSAAAGMAAYWLAPQDDVWKKPKAAPPPAQNHVLRMMHWLRSTW
ncbi:MAG: cell division protein FtsA [Neomegalonema sp.]|nr:cell division protein FtsA [Neomegalonema sp.]